MTKGCGNHTVTTCGSHCVSSSDCADSTGGCTSCVNNVCSAADLCGTICSGSGQCQSGTKCTQCVGYQCSEPASCGQVCLSSGQCASNPGNCKACLGTICDQSVACGGSCGGNDWCSTSCPVCSLHAKCASSFDHSKWLNIATEEEIKQWKQDMKSVTEETTKKNRMKFLGHY